MYERESIFFLNLCLPSLDTQGLDAALCPFCSITDALGKCSIVSESSQERLWPGGGGDPASPSLALRGLVGNATPTPRSPIWKAPAGREAAAGSRWPALLFQALSCWGSLGVSVLVARILQQECWILFYCRFHSPFRCCSSFRTVETKWSPRC